jgi:hypothetical protein
MHHRNALWKCIMEMHQTALKMRPLSQFQPISTRNESNDSVANFCLQLKAPFDPFPDLLESEISMASYIYKRAKTIFEDAISTQLDYSAQLNSMNYCHRVAT